MKTATKTQKVACECPKCGGSGFIRAFSNIANGVCFTCAGNGTVMVRPGSKKVPVATEYQTKHAEFILNLTEEQLEKMTYSQLSFYRNFAHWPCPGYPDLLKVWREKGDPFFFAAQEQRLAEMYS